MTEIVAFTQINGIPGDGIGDFVAALGDYSGESLLRIAALIAFDGLIPLGAGFTDNVLSFVKGLSPSELESNQTFKGVRELIPGDNAQGQLGFITDSLESTKGWIDSFVADNSLTQAGLVSNLSKFVEVSSDKLDYLGAFLDVSVKYYRHTGIQTLARRLIERAVAEI